MNEKTNIELRNPFSSLRTVNANPGASNFQRAPSVSEHSAPVLAFPSLRKPAPPTLPQHRTVRFHKPFTALAPGAGESEVESGLLASFLPFEWLRAPL